MRMKLVHERGDGVEGIKQDSGVRLSGFKS